MFFGGNSHQTLGLDIGTHTVKAVLLDHQRTPRVLKAGMREIRGESDYEPKQLRRSETLLALRELLAELRINPAKVKNLVSCLGGPTTSMKEITAVKMSEEELSASLVFEARKHLPLDDSDTVIDHQLLGPDPADNTKARILLVATTRKMYGWHESVLKEVGFTPGTVDIDQLAVTNSLLAMGELPEEGQVLILNLGARSTNFIVTNAIGRIFNRDLPLGGHHLTADLADKRGMPYAEAERLKIAEGVAAFHQGEGAGSALSLQTRTALEDFLDELRRTLRYFVKETGQSDFKKVYLTGGGALMKGLQEMIAEKFQMEVEVWNPLSQVEGSEVANGSVGPQFAQCTGLALRRD